MKRAEFMKHAHLDNTWNRTHAFSGIIIAGVMWHSNNCWKLVDTEDFDKISSWDDKSHIIAEFKYQEELWQYCRDNVFNKITA